MGISVRLTPIRPTRETVRARDLRAELDRVLQLEFAKGVIDDMSDYPPVRPWAHGFPKSGERRGGRRTGTYGRNWRISGRRRGSYVEVSNATEYGVHVGGPLRGPRGRRQAAFMRRRGWRSISRVARRRWQRTEVALVRVMGSRGSSVRFR